MKGLEGDILVGYRSIPLTAPASLRKHLFKVRLHVAFRDGDGGGGGGGGEGKGKASRRKVARRVR